jgi:hypothetical protein
MTAPCADPGLGYRFLVATVEIVVAMIAPTCTKAKAFLLQRILNGRSGNGVGH